MLGQTINNEYKLLKLLGRGGFGAVYEATELTLQRRVAIKLMNADIATEKESKLFLREARHLATLNHPNVVQIFAFGKYREQPYIVMELLDGKTLRKLLEDSPPSTAETLEIMIQVARGLQAIHTLGLVHRDLSTNNIMVTLQAVKILDLGLARDLRTISSQSKEGHVVGTVGYISPEQLQGKRVSTVSDVFSFGVILYEMLAGTNPFAAEHQMTTLYSILEREPKPLHADHNVPRNLSTLVTQCLSKNPPRRPQTMQHVEKALEQVLASAESAKTIQVVAPMVREPQQPQFGNPYTNRRMIKEKEGFFGRQEQIRKAFEHLNANPPGCISVVGERRIGKSSFLNFLYMPSNRQAYLDIPDRTIVLFLDFQLDTRMSVEDFSRLVLRTAELELQGNLDLSDSGQDCAHIEDLVARVDSAGYRIVILCDEFQAATRNPNFDLEFFSFLRALTNRYNIAYVTSSTKELHALCESDEIACSPFFNVFSTIRLSSFQLSEVEELIRVPSRKMGRPLEAFNEQIVAMSGRHPFFVQMACAALWEAHDTVPVNGKIDFETVREHFYQEARFHYRFIWDNLEKKEQEIVVRLARKERTPKGTDDIVRELVAKGYLTESPKGPRLFSPLFGAFVNNEMARKRRFWDSLLWWGNRGEDRGA